MAIFLLNLTDLPSPSLKSLFSFPSKIMISAKRRRNGSITATPTLSQSNDSPASSFMQSSPLHHFQPTKHPQQRPAKRISIHLPSRRPGSSTPSSDLRPAYGHSRLSSVATSAADVARESGFEGEQEEENDPTEVIMCVDMRERGTVGCCYYESSTGSLHLVEDIRCGGLEVIDTCQYLLCEDTCLKIDKEIVKLHIQPTVVILSMRVDEAVEQYFDPDGRSRGSVNGDGKVHGHHEIRQLTLYVLWQVINSLCPTCLSSVPLRNSLTMLGRTSSSISASSLTVAPRYHSSHQATMIPTMTTAMVVAKVIQAVMVNC